MRRVDATVEPATRATLGGRRTHLVAPALEPLVASSASPPHHRPTVDDDAATAMLARFASSMGPMFVGLQVGSTAGHLAEHALGSSAFPLPWPTLPARACRRAQRGAVRRGLEPRPRRRHGVHDRARARRPRRLRARPVAARVEALLAEATAAQMSAQRTLLERLTEADSRRGALVAARGPRVVRREPLGARGRGRRTRARRAERGDHRPAAPTSTRLPAWSPQRVVGRCRAARRGLAPASHRRQQGRRGGCAPSSASTCPASASTSARRSSPASSSARAPRRSTACSATPRAPDAGRDRRAGAVACSDLAARARRPGLTDG